MYYKNVRLYTYFNIFKPRMALQCIVANNEQSNFLMITGTAGLTRTSLMVGRFSLLGVSNLTIRSIPVCAEFVRRQRATIYIRFIELTFFTDVFKAAILKQIIWCFF